MNKQINLLGALELLLLDKGFIAAARFGLQVVRAYGELVRLEYAQRKRVAALMGGDRRVSSTDVAYSAERLINLENELKHMGEKVSCLCYSGEK